MISTEPNKEHIVNFMKNFKTMADKYEIRRKPVNETHKVRNSLMALIGHAGAGYAVKKLMNPETRRKVSDKLHSMRAEGLSSLKRKSTEVPITTHTSTSGIGSTRPF